ncbi:hypothetical protein BIW11_01862 [Tropilaelaps mercedesae]|uniref:Uncharacterized protein n=1 Tax=Tropilaelaps mercedesae TaxID=418985 RepID=A0A1V9X7G8_9ACAR|nr:hypothetical protein BIW11_01862 [Tropilaelaps mercedesae]
MGGVQAMPSPECRCPPVWGDGAAWTRTPGGKATRRDQAAQAVRPVECPRAPGRRRLPLARPPDPITSEIPEPAERQSA